MSPLLGQIRQKLDRGDLTGATELAREAYIEDVADPIVFDLMAFRYEQTGDLAAALKCLIRGAELTPEDASLHTSIGHCLIKLSRPTHALMAFNKALGLNPDTARAHHGAGLALASLGDAAAAEAAQRRALSLDPKYPDAIGALSLLAYQRREFVEAESLADRALGLEPRDGLAMLVKAMSLYDRRDMEGCVAFLGPRLGADIAPMQRTGLERTYADALDALARYDEAFPAYVTSNALLRQVHADLFDVPDVESTVAMCQRLLTDLDGYAEPIIERPADFAKNGCLEHVFLMGFPRSGTTLLEQVLATHPDIVALEEKATLHHGINDFFVNTRDIAHLMTASEAELEGYRETYWRKVKNFGMSVDGKVFVDKQPSLTLYIPLLAKLFPNSKIIFCVRDPRDVVLSCFRRAFRMNGTVFQYTDIDSLAAVYSATMRLAALYRRKFKIPIHDHKHEFMIENFEAESRGLCRFLGVDFDDNMKNFVDTAKARDIRTPSAKQVLAGLNSSGVGYWKHYRKFLEPHFAPLNEWVEHFGYEA